MTLADPVSPDLKRHLRTLKLGQLLATLPDRLTLARQNKLPHADFLELLLLLSGAQDSDVRGFWRH